MEAAETQRPAPLWQAAAPLSPILVTFPQHHLGQRQLRQVGLRHCMHACGVLRLRAYRWMCVTETPAKKQALETR